VREANSSDYLHAGNPKRQTLYCRHPFRCFDVLSTCQRMRQEDILAGFSDLRVSIFSCLELRGRS